MSSMRSIQTRAAGILMLMGLVCLAGSAAAQTAPVPDPCDFATSGGFVITDSGKKASFAAHGGCKHGDFWGQMNLVDHSSGYHVNGTEVTGYLAPFGMSDPTRDICGWATTNRTTDPEYVRFRVRVIDNGEPGSLDKYGVILGAEDTAAPGTFVEFYKITPRLLSAQKPGGGNVQLHGPNGSTTAPAGPFDEQALCGGLSFENPGGGGGGGGGNPE